MMTRHGNAARDPELEAKLREHLERGLPAGPAAAPPHASSPRRSLSRVVGSGRVGAPAPRHPPVYAFARVSSTMEVAHQLAADGAAEGTLVWASRQEQGRGRMGRPWQSPEGGVYLSLIVRPTRSAQETPQLSLIAGLATAQVIKELTGLFPSIRWPNDVLLGGLKVAGILVEARGDAVIVGIGINVTTRTEDLPVAATSLSTHLPRPSPRAPRPAPLIYELTGELCRRFRTWYDVWTAQGFVPIREALRPWMGLFGHPVHISAGSNRFEGTASDLDEDGRLVVRLDSGVLRAFEMGEVTLLR